MIDQTAIRVVAREAHRIAVEHGFWTALSGWIGPRTSAAVALALIHSEVSEAMEVLRDLTLGGDALRIRLGEELADIVIRAADLAEHEGVDLGLAIAGKMLRNEVRPHRHGKAF